MCNIGGDKGSANGFSVLEKLMHSLISSNYLQSISWTGRGKGKERKVALSTFEHVINFITVMVKKADANYSSDKVQHDITYEILKRAPSKSKNKTMKRNIRVSSVSSEASVLSQK